MDSQAVQALSNPLGPALGPAKDQATAGLFIEQILQHFRLAVFGHFECLEPHILRWLQRRTECQTHRASRVRSEEHTSELQSRGHLVCRLLLEKKNGTETDTWSKLSHATTRSTV